MSGGSYGYFYNRVELIADEIAPTTPLRRAFKAHLAKVARALHDIEWVDSGDSSPGQEDEALHACIGTEAELTQVVAEAKAVSENLTKLLAAIESRRA